MLVLGAGGKSGILCAAEARRAGGKTARIIGIESYEAYAEELRALEILATSPSAPTRAIRSRSGRPSLAANGGREVGVSFSCVNGGDAEMAAILEHALRGIAYFFADVDMSSTKAALGAEGGGKYRRPRDRERSLPTGHAEHTLRMMREMPAVKALFEAREQLGGRRAGPFRPPS